MAAEKGNQFWKLRSKHGRDKLFETPELLLEAAFEYFQWCDENPLQEEKLFSYQGAVVKDVVNKMRAYTKSGLCLYLGCSESYFRVFKSTAKERKNEDFLTVIEELETIIDTQNFTGAASDLLNANIIARKLGISDSVKNENTNKNYNSEPISKEELKQVEDELENDF